jgi:hypothetical protein
MSRKEATVAERISPLEEQGRWDLSQLPQGPVIDTWKQQKGRWQPGRVWLRGPGYARLRLLWVAMSVKWGLNENTFTPLGFRIRVTCTDFDQWKGEVQATVLGISLLLFLGNRDLFPSLPD